MISGLPTVVTNNLYGKYIPGDVALVYNTKAELTDILGELIENADKRRDLAARGRAYAMKYFDMETAVGPAFEAQLVQIVRGALYDQIPKISDINGKLILNK